MTDRPDTPPAISPESPPEWVHEDFISDAPLSGDLPRLLGTLRDATRSLMQQVRNAETVIDWNDWEATAQSIESLFSKIEAELALMRDFYMPEAELFEQWKLRQSEKKDG